MNYNINMDSTIAGLMNAGLVNGLLARKVKNLLVKNQLNFDE